MERGHLVRVMHSFSGIAKDKLNLTVGSVLQVIRMIDRYWIYGYCDGVYGNFPTGLVSALTMPPIEPGQQLFVAKEDFIAQELEDLGFHKGDVIVGLVAVDSNWWNGKLNSQIGIFPLNMVWKVDMSLIQAQVDKGCEQGQVRFRAKVNMDLKAQLDEEMDLFKGEIVTVTELVDKDWYKGECNGRKGIFPSAFVTALDESASSTLPDLLSFENTDGKSAPSTDEFDPIAIYNTDEPSLPPPAIPPPPLPSSPDRYGSLQDLQDIVIADRPQLFHSLSVMEPHCKTLYTFVGEFSNELSFGVGEMIRLVRRIDSQWVEGELNGKVGLFPLCYVQVIVDLPRDDEQTSLPRFANVEDDSTGDKEEEAVALYDFYPQVEGDVCVHEGELVTVVERLSESWYRVRNVTGDVGLCPGTYLQLLDNTASSSSEKLHRHLSLPVFSRASKDYKWQKAIINTKLSNGEGSSANLLDISKSPGQVGNSEYLSTTAHSDHSQNSSWTPANLVSAATKAPKSPRKYSPPLYSQDSGRRSSLPSSCAPARKIPPPRPPPLQVNQHLESPVTKITTQDRSTRIPLRPAPPVPVHVRRPVSAHAALTPPSPLTARIRPRGSGRRTMSDARSRKSSFSKEGNEIKVVVQDVDNDEIESCQIRRKDYQHIFESQVSPQEAQERNREKRRMIVNELIQTERDYVRNMQECRDTFMQNPEDSKAHGINVDLLFGYVNTVLCVNRTLLDNLEDTVKMSTSNQNIGNCFQQVAADMKKVYGDYCANHDDVISLLEKYEENPETVAFIQEKLRIGANPSFFSLSSVLIKPVQRVLKYPLLLNELIKVTENDSPDKPDLLSALKVMTDVADEINECKRRKELVVKYRKETDGGLTAKISKLSIHSMVKKSQRIGMRLSSHLGLVSVTKDVAFDEIEQKFRDTERTVRQLLKDAEQFCTSLEECVISKFNLAEHISNYYEDQRTRKDVDSFRTIQRNIRTTIWPEFKNTVDLKVLKPLTSLLHLYEGPNKLIEKRNDKLLDYDSASQRLEKNKDVSRGKQLRDELQQANKNYSALNSRLLEELPKLVQLSIEILVKCVGAFLAARRRFIGHTTNHLFELTEQIPGLAPSDDILTSFCERHAEIVNWMTITGIIQKESHSSPRVERASKEKVSAVNKGQAANTSLGSQLKYQKSVCQSSSQKAYLQGRYTREVLYCAIQTYTPTSDLELPLNAGDLVAIIKQKDPMGGTERWFVDNGIEKGFVPSNILTPMTTNLDKVPASNSKPPSSPQSLRKCEESWTSEPVQHYQNCYDMVPAEDETQFRYDYASCEGFELLETNGARYDIPGDFDPFVTGDGKTEMEFAQEHQPWLEQNGQLLSSTGTGQFEDPQAIGMDPAGTLVLTNPSEANDENEYYYSTFAFTATGPNELSLAQGQVVLVRHKQDLQGNPEWWYVEDRYGNQGYAPANYLLHYPMTTE